MQNIKFKIVCFICLIILLNQPQKTYSQENASITISNTQFGTTFQIENDLLFKNDSLDITPMGFNIIDKIAETIKQTHTFCIVESSTQKFSHQNTNINSDWELTIIRSDKIINYLISEHGINPQRVFSSGFGEKLPTQKHKNRTTFILKNTPNLFIE